jgi:hypothetical protein
MPVRNGTKMKIEVEISEAEIVEATKRAIKKAIVDTINSGDYRNGKYKTVITKTVDEMLPKLIEESLSSESLKAMVDNAVEAKAKRVISKMVNK